MSERDSYSACVPTATPAADHVRTRLRQRRRELIPVVQKLRPYRRGGVAVGVATTQTAANVEPAEGRRGSRRGVRGRKRRLEERGRERDEKKMVERCGDATGNKTTAECLEKKDAKEEEKEESKQVTTESEEKSEEEEENKQDIFIPKLQRTTASHNLLTTLISCEFIETSRESEGHSCENNRTVDVDEERETEYPKPSSNHQKIQRKLARQRQLDEFRARESSLAREERLMRRRGLLLATPPKEGKGHRVMWKEEKLVEVFQYSPVSSRGSTLEPDDLPELD